MKKYRAKASVEAIRVMPAGRNHSDLMVFGNGQILFDSYWDEYMVRVTDTIHYACMTGHWIVKIDGDFVEPISDEVFTRTYEEVS